MKSVFLFVALALPASATATQTAAAAHAHRWHHGAASWYEGARGACGKPMRGFYAAHRTLKCGTTLAVCRRHRCIVVTVLDRGPVRSTGRKLDLSRSAARALGYESLGVARVAYRIVP